MKDIAQGLIDQELIDSCLVEFREHIDEAVRNILLLEKKPEDTEGIESLFRNFHTIKGNASIVGFEKIIRLSILIGSFFRIYKMQRARLMLQLMLLKPCFRVQLRR